MKQQDLRIVKTKKGLHNTLISLLQTKSLNEITVTELCKESNITRKTFYLHYESVASLFGERIQQIINDLEKSFLTTAEKRREIKTEDFYPHMIHIFQHVHDNQQLYKIIFSAKSKFAYYEMFFVQIKKLVKKSVDTIGKFDNINDFVLSYQANAILGLIIEWCQRDFAESVEFMNETLIAIIDLYKVS